MVVQRASDGAAYAYILNGTMVGPSGQVPGLSQAQYTTIGFPDLDGIRILEIIRRERRRIPVLILTARDSIEDRIKGLDAGADDYLVKPFDSGELNARIRALIRRSSGRSTPIITHGNISCNPSSHQVLFKGKEMALTQREYVLLKKLLEHPEKVISKEHLSQSLYGWKGSISSNTIEVYIHSLRKKFYSNLIKNIRGVGYMIGPPVQVEELVTK
jgi:DNA-binding response OmpR family regulator